MLNSTNVGDGDYFPTFWQEDIHCRFSHATIAAMCSPLYLIWLGFTMSVVALSQKQKGLDPMQGVQPFCVYVSVEAAGYSCLPNKNRLMPKTRIVTKAW